ncbi:hypothetical protein HQ544_01520 [Candidatus Falkowbacteria bacterium]|nr:hypothetical protein [Candidatus Falkowbacteria bacterium]
MAKILSDKDSKEQSEVTLLKDSQWSVIDGELCRVIDFVPWGLFKNGEVLALNKTTPYASVHLECKKLPGIKITGFIYHKMDFTHLWMAFKERTIKQGEEVLIIWSKRHYKNIFYKIFSAFMPKLWVMVCPKGAFELETNPGYRPELNGEARWNGSKPITDWKPEVMI